MRGRVNRQIPMFVAIDLEERIPANHPLRKVKRWADEILSQMRGDFAAAYGTTGRPGIPPEQLLKAMLLRAIYSIPSERRLMEAIELNVLYRWFVDLEQDAPAWSAEVFSMNRERFLEHGLVRKFFDRVVAEGFDRKLASNDHFTVDGTLVRSLASHKSVERIDADKDKDKDKGKDKDDSKGGDGGASAASTTKAQGSRDASVDWRGGTPFWPHTCGTSTEVVVRVPPANLKGGRRAFHCGHTRSPLAHSRRGPHFGHTRARRRPCGSSWTHSFAARLGLARWPNDHSGRGEANRRDHRAARQSDVSAMSRA